MKDLQQAAMFRNWVQEIEKHHSYLDYLEPKEYLVDKFLEYLNERILELQKMKWNFLEANPKFMYKLYGGGDTLSLPELESHIKVKAIILERKDNKKKVASISEASEEFLKTGEPISVSIPSSIMNINSPIEPKGTPPQEPVKTPPQIEKSTFDELFHESKYIEPCINLLKQLDPPLIDSDCNFIGNNKSAICIWVDEMVRNGIMKPQQGKTFALLIPQRIKGLSISESLFRKVSTRAKERYGKDIAVLISQIKHSQDYQ